MKLYLYAIKYCSYIFFLLLRPNDLLEISISYFERENVPFIQIGIDLSA